MAELVRKITYRCANDCAMSGCPGHVGALRWHSVSDAYLFVLNGRELDFERGELEALLALLRTLDRLDAVNLDLPR